MYIYIYAQMYKDISHATFPSHLLVYIYISDLCNAIVNVKWWPVTRPARSLRVNTTTNNQKKHGRSISAAAGWTIRTAPCTGKTNPSRRECIPGIRHHELWGPRFFTAHSQTVALHTQLYDTLWHDMKTAIINHDILEYSTFVDTLQ